MPMLELKHQARQIVSIKTRAQYTAQKMGDLPPVLARPNVRPPADVTDHNEYIARLHFQRTPGQKVDQSSLISTREMYDRKSDVVEVKRTRKTNLEFDFKRKPLNPYMVSTPYGDHIAFDTEPWPTAAAANEARTDMDQWRRKNNLRTMADWESWEDFHETRKAIRGTRLKITAEGGVGILRRLFLRAYVQNAWGTSKNQTNAELATFLTDAGYPTKTDEIKSGSRSALVRRAVPVTLRVIRLLKVLLQIQPALDLQELFSAEALEKARRMLQGASDE